MTGLPRGSLALVASLAFVNPAALRADEAAGKAPAQPLFSRHIVGVLGRLGCNSGACHGTVQGQNGFRLTLFGADPALDHARLVRELGGRRLNLTDPDASLLLLKAAGRVPHAGGRQTHADAPEYLLLRAWIAQGAPLDAPAASQLKALRVEPAQQTLKVGASYALRVEATFADGTTEDVTGLCTFDVSNREVAAVDRSGLVEARGVGDAAVIVRFRSDPVLAALLVPGEPVQVQAPPAGGNFIDAHVNRKLQTLQISAADGCDDAAFLRRATLDLAGELPTPDEVRAFLADKAADKRTRKIDELLARPGHAALWATKFCDVLKPTGFNGNDKFVEPVEARRFYAWLRARFQEGTPYDELVERILTATSREGRSVEEWAEEARLLAEEAADSSRPLEAYARRRTLDLYWQKSKGNNDGGSPSVKAAVQVAHAFLGLRLECAQCHRHPHDVWQQDDLLSFANFFSRVSPGGNNGSSAEAKKDTKALTEQAKQQRAAAKDMTEKIAKDKSLPKEEADRIRREADALNKQASALEGTAGRLQSTEIHTQVKGVPASTSSPLGRQSSTTFRLLGQNQGVTVPEGEDPRTVVMAWLRRPDNPFFAKAIVNRVWAHYFGRGLIDPADHLSPLNPPSHPELLDELCAGFIQHKYDLKWLHRTIAGSHAYQRSSQGGAGSPADARNYARFNLRRLPAEMVVDAVNHATGGSETFPAEARLPAGSRAMELAGDMKADSRDAKAAALAYALQIYGRPLRSPDVQCDCERGSTPSVLQTLYLLNHPAMREKIASPQGRPAQIVKEHADEARRVEEVFLWVLARLPAPEERAKAAAYVRSAASPQKGVEGLFRTLLLSDEFILNH